MMMDMEPHDEESEKIEEFVLKPIDNTFCFVGKLDVELVEKQLQNASVCIFHITGDYEEISSQLVRIYSLL